MKRDIIFFKNVGLINVLLKTGKCTNEGDFILRCEDKKEDMEILQKACSDYLANTEYKNYRLCFANSEDYGDIVIIEK